MQRVYALYESNRKILVLLLVSGTFASCGKLAVHVSIMAIEKSASRFLLSISIGYIAIALLLFLWRIVSVLPFPGTQIRFCAALNFPTFYIADWIPTLVLESLLFALALVKGYQSIRLEIFKLGTAPRGMRLVACLVKDSLLYFFV